MLNKANVIGKEGEAIAKSLFEQFGYDVERLPDSYDVGNIIKGGISDFVVGGRDKLYYMEVKTTTKGDFSKSGLRRKTQIPRQLMAAKKRAPGFYAFVCLKTKTVYLYHWDQVIHWYAKLKGDLLTTGLMPFSTINYSVVKQRGKKSMYEFSNLDDLYTDFERFTNTAMPFETASLVLKTQSNRKKYRRYRPK